MRFLKTTRIIASVVLAAYLFVPFVDTVACEDCINSVKHTLNQSLSYGSAVSPVNPGRAADIRSSTQTQTSLKDFCQVCFGTAKIISTETVEVVFSPVFFTYYLPEVTTPILIYALIKPPEV